MNLWRDLRGNAKMKWKLVFALCLFRYLDLSLPFHSQIQDSNKALIFCVKSILLLWLEKLMILVSVSCWQQTNTADMLDLAVDYIKDLQKQYKVFEEELARKWNPISFNFMITFIDTELDHKTGHKRYMNRQNSLWAEPAKASWNRSCSSVYFPWPVLWLVSVSV